MIKGVGFMKRNIIKKLVNAIEFYEEVVFMKYIENAHFYGIKLNNETCLWNGILYRAQFIECNFIKEALL